MNETMYRLNLQVGWIGCPEVGCPEVGCPEVGCPEVGLSSKMLYQKKRFYCDNTFKHLFIPLSLSNSPQPLHSHDTTNSTHPLRSL